MGEGTFFTVRMGRDRRTGRSVVVKFLKPEFSSDESVCARLLEAASRASKLSHPGLVRVLGSGQRNGRPFVVCEWRSGVGLRRKLMVEKRLEPRQALTWAAQVARALAGIHASGEAHGDVRPEHVVICGPEGAKLRDPLLSLPFGSHPALREYWLGRSAPYVAPEVVQGQAPSPASDIYSLGATLFEMLTGRPPFVGGSVGQVLLKHLREGPPSVLQFLPHLPRELDELLRRCMAKRPGERPSASEVADRLTEIMVKLRAIPAGNAGPPRATGGGKARGLVASLLLGLLKAFVWSVGVLLGIALIFGLLYLAWRLTTPKEVTVPYVIGMPLSQAAEVMERHGLKLRWVGEEFSDRYPAGTVVRTDPPPGQRIREGREVRAIISKGAKLVEVPNVIGLTLEEARVELEAAGLSVSDKDIVRRYDPTAPLGEVLDQSPKPGEKVGRGSEVSLVVSKGPRPSFEGRAREGLLQQQPEGAARGTEGLERKSAIVEVTVPPGLGKQEVRIEVEDADGVRTVFDDFRAPGERVAVKVTGRGRTLVRVFLNEELVKEQEL